MENSIFDLADKFGYNSQFKNDWIKEDFLKKEIIPTISFKGEPPKIIVIDNKTLVEFIISGDSHYFKNYISVEILVDDINISFSTTKWTNVDNGWTLRTYVIAKEPGIYMLKFKLNNNFSNSLPLTFVDKSENESSECLCKKISWTSKDLQNIVRQLRKLDTRKIKRNPLDKRGNRTYLDGDGNVIPSTDTGRKPENATKMNIVIVDFSLFDDVAEDGKSNEDRLFMNKANGQNLDSKKSNYDDFSKQLNRVFKEYNINTCLRKIHFLAQIYQETNRFRSTFENVSNTGYHGGDFYQGRGMKQITHDYNYLEYYSYVYKSNIFDLYMQNRIGFESVGKFNKRTNNQYISVSEMNKVDELVTKISIDIYYACDSAGWYWSKNKINEYADKDDILSVSAKVNNPSAINKTTSNGINGFEERKKYYDLLKIILEYENCQ